jgi:hypothetical protein
MTTTRYWVIGGDYQQADFSRLVAGTEIILGPFADHQAAKYEWTRLTNKPGARESTTTRYSIASEELRTAA